MNKNPAQQFWTYFAESMSSVGMPTPTTVYGGIGDLLKAVAALGGAYKVASDLGNPTIPQVLRECFVRSPAAFALLARIWPSLGGSLATMTVPPELAAASFARGVGLVQGVGTGLGSMAAFYVGSLVGATCYAAMRCAGLDLAVPMTDLFTAYYVGDSDNQLKRNQRKLQLMREAKAKAASYGATIPPNQLRVLVDEAVRKEELSSFEQRVQHSAAQPFRRGMY